MEWNMVLFSSTWSTSDEITSVEMLHGDDLGLFVVAAICFFNLPDMLVG